MRSQCQHITGAVSRRCRFNKFNQLLAVCKVYFRAKIIRGHNPAFHTFSDKSNRYTHTDRIHPELIAKSVGIYDRFDVAVVKHASKCENSFIFGHLEYFACRRLDVFAAAYRTAVTGNTFDHVVISEYFVVDFTGIRESFAHSISRYKQTFAVDGIDEKRGTFFTKQRSVFLHCRAFLFKKRSQTFRVSQLGPFIPFNYDSFEVLRPHDRTHAASAGGAGTDTAENNIGEDDLILLCAVSPPWYPGDHHSVEEIENER